MTGVVVGAAMLPTIETADLYFSFVLVVASSLTSAATAALRSSVAAKRYFIYVLWTAYRPRCAACSNLPIVFQPAYGQASLFLPLGSLAMHTRIASRV